MKETKKSQKPVHKNWKHKTRKISSDQGHKVFFVRTKIKLKNLIIQQQKKFLSGEQEDIKIQGASSCSQQINKNKNKKICV